MFLQAKPAGVGGGQFPKALTKEEEKYYLDLYESDDEEIKKEARNILIERNLRLVAHIVKKYNVKDIDDYISIGTIGLIKGVSTFNRSRGSKLSTYVSRCIENEILMYMRSIKKINKESFLLDPIGVDKEGNKITMEDKLADEGYFTDDVVSLKMDSLRLRELLKALPEREKRIIELRYGLKTGIEITQRETAKRLNISRSYVSRIEKKTLSTLNQAMNS